MLLKEINNAPRLDVNTINSDHNVDCTASIGSLNGMECGVERKSLSDALPQVNSDHGEMLPKYGENKFEAESSCSQREGSSRPEIDSPANSTFKCPKLESSSSDEYIDVVPDADASLSERSPSTSSYIGEDDDPLDGPSPEQCFGNWQMVDGGLAIECFPEYIVYGDRYLTDSVIIFSSESIKIKSLTMFGNSETFVFWWPVDDIVKVESEWCKRLQLAMVKIYVVPKGMVRMEDLHGTSVIEELKFAIFEDWCEKQEAIISLDVYRPLWKVVDSDLERDEEVLYGRDVSLNHYFPFFNESFEDVIYPKGDSDAVSISKRDVDLLQPDTFVNDTIIDFYIKYLKNKIEPDERHRFHFFNSFFFRKLADLDKNPSSTLDGRAAFLRVRKWTRKIDLFKKDFVFIPVNFNYHWSLIVICHLGEVAEFKEADAPKSVKVPCILHMDSIRGSHSGLKDLLQSYLWEEWKERHKDTPCDISSRFLKLRFLSLELPQQPNLYDCGLFLLHYVELFLEGVPENFNPFKITTFSNFLTADWFQPFEASLKRTFIQRLIYDLLGEGSHENFPDSGNDKKSASNCPKSSDKNGTAVEFAPKRCSPSKVFHENIPSSQAGQGIELTLLPRSSLDSSQCANNSGFVLRELFEPGAVVGSFSQAYEQSAPFDEFKSAMPPIKGLEETGRHFGHSPSAETGFEQLVAIAPEASGPYLSGEFRGEPSWSPETFAQQTSHEDFNSLPAETSLCASDNSQKLEAGIDSLVGTNLSLEAKIDPPPKSPSIDGDRGSAPTEISDPSTNHSPGLMRNGNDTEDVDPVTPYPKNLLGLTPQDFEMEENGNATCENAQSVYDYPSVSEPKHVLKKRRLTTTEGEEDGEGLPRSEAGDLQL